MQAIFGRLSGSLTNIRERHLAESFVSSLAVRCVGDCSQGKLEFGPWAGEGALLFIDMSGYSGISAALEYKGAYVISVAVCSGLCHGFVSGDPVACQESGIHGIARSLGAGGRARESKEGVAWGAHHANFVTLLCAFSHFG